MTELNLAHSQRVKSPPPIMSLTDYQRRYNPKRSKDVQSLGAEQRCSAHSGTQDAGQQSRCGRYRVTPCRRVSERWITWDRGTCSAGRGREARKENRYSLEHAARGFTTLW